MYLGLVRGMLGRSNGCVVVDPVENNQSGARARSHNRTATTDNMGEPDTGPHRNAGADLAPADLSKKGRARGL